MAWQSRAVERLRGLPWPDVLLRMLLLHVARGYSLRETVVRAKLANWTDISDVALLKRQRNSEEYCICCVIDLLRENVAYRLEDGISRTLRIVDGTIVREPGKTGSQWRILYSIRLSSLVCDFFEVTGHDWRRQRRVIEPYACGSARTYSRGCRLLLNRWN